MQKTYKVRLRGVEKAHYRQNPVVTEGWDRTALPIGMAKITNNTVIVNYKDNVPAYPHTLGASYVFLQNHKRELIGLSVIPIMEDYNA